MVQWLRICACTAGGMGSIPGQGNKIPHVTQCSQKEKKKVVEVIKELLQSIGSAQLLKVNLTFYSESSMSRQTKRENQSVNFSGEDS